MTAKAKSRVKSKTAAKTAASSVTGLPFGKKNYLALGIGLVIMFIGYWMISGEEFIDATEFSMALYVAPFIILGGLVVVGVSIMLRPEDEQFGEDNESAMSGSQEQ